MKRNGVGLNASVSLIQYTDKFITDYANNFAPPQWVSNIIGYAPLEPSVFTKDNVAPELSSWIFDRPNLEFLITFNEPVELLDGSLFEVFVADYGTGLIAGNGFMTLDGGTAEKVEGTNTIKVTVPESCVVTAGDGTCTTTLVQTLSTQIKTLWLTLQVGGVQDLSDLQSVNIETPVTEPLREGAPDCSDCPSGSYTSKLCTSNADRVCTACTLCGVGEYESVPCSQFVDTRCAICESCPVGTYISGTCSGASDVKCSYCTRCKASEYEAASCTGSADTICQSCNTCTFNTESAQRQCESGQYLYYFNNNCCLDEFSGSTVACNHLGYSRARAAATTGRHHWVFPDTSPPIEGFEFPLAF
jgi:hypothetical protein